MFNELGAYVVDADEVIHTFYRKGHPVYEEVLREFGEGILSEDGSIDRRRLADIVFKDEGKLRRLEEITHRALYEELDRFYSRLPEDAVAVVEASLLIEKGTYRNYDRTVVVYAPYEVCKERALRRGFSEEDFERRWRNQMPIEDKLKFADYVIDNSDGLDRTREQVLKVFKAIKEDP